MDFDLEWLNTDDFTWRAALALVNACVLAYEAPAAVDTQLQAWGVVADRVTHFDEGNVEGFVAETDDLMLITLRGSNDFEDWKANLRTEQVNVPTFHGKVHRGFVESYNLVAHEIAAKIADAGDRRVWITGHSLGAAVGLIILAQFAQAVPQARLVTFGQPAMLNKASATWVADNLGTRYVRIVNDIDIVANRLAPWQWQSGQKFHFNEHGALQSRAEARSKLDAPRRGLQNLLKIRELRKIVRDAVPDSLSDKLSWFEGVPQHTCPVYARVVRDQVFPDAPGMA